jgi:GntR family transcriptional regulator
MSGWWLSVPGGFSKSVLLDVIERTSALPYYAQLKEMLWERIRLNEWKAHDRLPSEAELCQRYGVSRTVVRQALTEMVQEGALYRQKGKGTYVAEPKIVEGLFQQLIGFHEEMALRRMKLVTHVLEQRLVTAEGRIAAALKIPVGEQVIRIVRLRIVEGVPTVLSTTFVPNSCCPGLLQHDLTNCSLYGTAENEFGLHISHGSRAIEVEKASVKEAGLLGIKPGQPLVLVESHTFLRDGSVFDFSVAKHRADRCRFEVQLVRTQRNLESLVNLVSPGPEAE